MQSALFFMHFFMNCSFIFRADVLYYKVRTNKVRIFYGKRPL